MEGHPQKRVKNVVQSLSGLAKAVADVNHPMWKGMPKIEGTMIHKFALKLIEAEDLFEGVIERGDANEPILTWLSEYRAIAGAN